MASILIRTVIIYILLTVSLRIMGKRQIGELDVGDLVSTLLVSELAAIPIDDPDIPLMNAVIPILLVISLEIILSTLKNKSAFLKRTFDGEPVYIIYNGRLLQSNLRDNRISLDELLSELRSQGVFDICEVEYAIIEQNGTLSVKKYDGESIAHTLLIDGEILTDSVYRLGLDRRWVEKRLAELEMTVSETFLMTVDGDGKTTVIKKEQENED
ncbi:MAG: DUF421 domain-containing protein [Clostridia bacterium]|nr:DUF421 domain-containing protein [Clostridia bacterium]